MAKKINPESKSAEWVRLSDDVRVRIDAYRDALQTLTGETRTRSAVIRHVLQSAEVTRLLARPLARASAKKGAVTK